MLSILRLTDAKTVAAINSPEDMIQYRRLSFHREPPVFSSPTSFTAIQLHLGPYEFLLNPAAPDV